MTNKSEKLLIMLVAAVIALLLILTAINTSYCQMNTQKHYWWKQGIGAGAMFTAGYLHGVNEVCINSYDRYLKRHPNTNQNYTNPSISFKRKYKEYPTDKSPAYWGSTSVLAWSSDAYHLRSTIKNMLIVGNLGISLTLYTKPNWKQIALQAATSWGSYALGTGVAHWYYR